MEEILSGERFHGHRNSAVKYFEEATTEKNPITKVRKNMKTALSKDCLC